MGALWRRTSVWRGIDSAFLPSVRNSTATMWVLQLTQIGKEATTAAPFSRRWGECIMPKQGVFHRVLHGGDIRPGDDFQSGAPLPGGCHHGERLGCHRRYPGPILSGPVIQELGEEGRLPRGPHRASP